MNETVTEESNPGCHQPFERGSDYSGRITWKTHKVKQRGHLEVFYLAGRQQQAQEQDEDGVQLVVGQCLVETVDYLVGQQCQRRHHLRLILPQMERYQVVIIIS